MLCQPSAPPCSCPLASPVIHDGRLWPSGVPIKVQAAFVFTPTILTSSWWFDQSCHFVLPSIDFYLTTTTTPLQGRSININHKYDVHETMLWIVNCLETAGRKALFASNNFCFGKLNVEHRPRAILTVVFFLHQDVFRGYRLYFGVCWEHWILYGVCWDPHKSIY